MSGVRPAELAASYAFGLVKDHPFVDGNKRVALVAVVAFLDRNGVELTASNAEALTAIVAVAAGDMTEGELVDWIKAHNRASSSRAVHSPRCLDDRRPARRPAEPWG